MRKYLVAAALLVTSVRGFGQDVDKLIKQDDVERIIKTLSADDMQGRGTFTPGIDKAATFIEGEFKAAGIKPLAGATGFRQNFSMLRSTPVSSKLTINGAEVPADKFVISGSGSFSWSSLEGVNVVKIAADKNFGAEYQALLKSGKNTVALLDSSYASMFKRLVSRAKRGGTSFKGANDTEKPIVFVMAGIDDVKSLAVTYEAKTEEKPLFNVAGMIPGKTKPNEYVVFSGHYDHLGIIKPMDGDSIANGADDDASGTTAVIELAKYYKKLNNNERTLVFVAFTAEEIGGFGSQYFSKQMNPDQVVAMFNIEMIGKASKFGENSACIYG
jgi:Iap family predicted aminopeptidase